jgi:signal peptidase I
MKKYNKQAVLYVLFISFMILLNLFVLGIRSRLVICLALIIAFLIGLFLFNYKKDNLYQKKSVIIVLFLIAIIEMVLFYLIGFKTGFSSNYLKLNLSTLLYIILPLIVIIIISEIIRYILTEEYRYDSFLNILVIIMFVLLDINLFGSSYNFKELDSVLEFLGMVLFPSITSNIVFNKLSLDYGYKPIISYRLITIITLYLIPVVPNLYVFFRSILRIIIPLLIYLLISYMFDRVEFEEVIKKKISTEISLIILLIVVFSFAALISCKFTYGLLTIGSGSMTGTLNIGDAVFYKKFKEQDLNIGDIVIYQRNNRSIVHRIVEIGIFNGQYVYITKGDNNQNVDEGYVYSSDIKGKVINRVRFIGYPSIWVRELFEE